jgi:hypothetical protein
MQHKRLAFVLLTLFLWVAPLQAEETLTPQKHADIERLFAMTGALDLGKQFAAVFIAEYTKSLKKMRPDIPDNLINILPGEVLYVIDANMQSFKDELIPIYHNHFTHDEIRGLIDFYSTELGQKAIRTMPQMMQDGMVAGERWGQTLVPQVEQRIRDRFRREGVAI